MGLGGLTFGPRFLHRIPMPIGLSFASGLEVIHVAPLAMTTGKGLYEYSIIFKCVETN